MVVRGLMPGLLFRVCLHIAGSYSVQAYRSSCHGHVDELTLYHYRFPYPFRFFSLSDT